MDNLTTTPETDAAEMDALTLDIPGQQTTDKVVRSYVARALEIRLLAANERIRVLTEALENICEYWNGRENETAMADARHYILDTASKVIAAAQGVPIRISESALADLMKRLDETDPSRP